jgi:hypothetical protein
MAAPIVDPAFESETRGPPDQVDIAVTIDVDCDHGRQIRVEVIRRESGDELIEATWEQTWRRMGA